MAGTNARHAASTRKTTCLATTIHQTKPTNTTINRRNKPGLCGSSTPVLPVPLAASAEVGDRHPTTPPSFRGVRGSAQTHNPKPPPWGRGAARPTPQPKPPPWGSGGLGPPGKNCGPSAQVGEAHQAAVAARWRWDLNPRRGCPLTRFRGVRPRPLGDSTVAELTRVGVLVEPAAPAGGEELAEQIAALGGEHAAEDLRLVVKPTVPEHIPERTDRAGFGILGAEDHPVEAGQGNRAGTHRARLKRHDKSEPGQPPAPGTHGGRADGNDLRVRGGVLVGFPAIAARSEYGTFRVD